MTTLMLALPLSNPIRGPVKKRRVLLVDTSPGKPEYLADSPNTNGASSVQNDGGIPPQDEMRAAPSADISGGPPLRWGILEASRRISAVRSASAARSMAMRNRPAPPRDVEARYSKPAPAESQILPELQKEEMQ